MIKKGNTYLESHGLASDEVENIKEI